jgi:endonuclease/exonuclease/phosphatase family metal-dependent hydrolase
MGKLAIYKYVSFLCLIITVIIAIFTFVGLFGGSSNPAGNTLKAMLVYALPFLIIADVVTLIFWLVRRRWHWALIPLVTILCCIPYMGTLYQFRSLNEATNVKTGLKVATYNVFMFNRETTGFIAQDILSQMKKQKVDVLCMQEYNEFSGDKKNSDSYKEYFPYMAKGREDMVIYSRHPIKENKTIQFDQTNNSAMWADIEYNGQTIRVFNVHLETTGFNRTLRKVSKLQMKGVKVEDNAIMEAIFGNYTLGMIARAGQANIVANEQRMSNNPCIVCGDFNDVPYSYVYNTMLGNMVDGFKECGSGWMYTYRGKKRVRIDYIFHDEALKGLNYYKMDLSYSDHYPVFMKFEL